MNSIEATLETISLCAADSAPGTDAAVCEGIVRSIRDDGTVLVDCTTRSDELFNCSWLRTSNSPPPKLTTGNRVLVWSAAPDDSQGVILGLIASPLDDIITEPEQDEVPDELVIEASKQLKLKCGDGSVTLRGDGKVLIKGKDLVSRAQRMNRVKGGAVAIN